MIHTTINKQDVLNYDVDWAPNEPHNGHCIAIHMESNGYSSLTTIDCSSQQPFFCQTENKAFQQQYFGKTSNRAKTQKNYNGKCKQEVNEVNSTSNFLFDKYY